MIPTHQKAAVLHKLILIERSARAAQEAICQSDEAEAQSKTAPRLVIAHANGNGPKVPQPADYAAAAQKLHAMAQVNLGAVIAVAASLGAVLEQPAEDPEA